MAFVLVWPGMAAWAGSTGLADISLNDPGINYQGIRYVDIQPDLVSFSRFDPQLLEQSKSQLGFNPDKARNTTGGLIAFRTASRVAQLTFRATEGMNRGSEFAAYINGRLIKSFRFNPKQDVLNIRVENNVAEGPALWELTLPSFANVELVSMAIDKDSSLIEAGALAGKIYVALGDSITHGTGQGSATHLTWPFILARQLDYTLYNLAVGGSGVAIGAARSLSAFEQIDLITILFGYNDWAGEGNSEEEFGDEYRALLKTIRASHPETPVYCISPLVTRRKLPKNGGLPIEEFRVTLRHLVEELGASDNNLHFIDGTSISSYANLRPEESGDPVHLSVEGAALLARSILPLLNDQSQ
jgi:lysophospholipase L1-like esterase